MGVLIHKIEKILKKRGGKKEKKYILPFSKRKDWTASFELTQSVEQSNEGFRTIFDFKIGQQTKKFTPKWHICCLINGW